MPGRARRARISAAFAAFHAASEAALGAAVRLRDAAAREHAEAMVELWLRTDGLDVAAEDPRLAPVFANPRLAHVVARVAADREAALEPWLASGPAALDALLREHAPGSAGAPASEWLAEPGKHDGSGPVPQLWRIGAGELGGRGFGVGVPLLDESHLQVTSTPATRAAAEALVETLLLRVVAHFRPGLVALHVWDTGQFAGTMPGLYPLTRTGLLTVRDPGDLAGLLAELSDRIRRVHTRVLVDGAPSLRALAAATGGARAEPWIVALLVGDRRALGEEEHQQLQRVLRGGLACGVQMVLLDVPVTVAAAVETVRLRDDGRARSSMTGELVRLRPDPPPDRAEVIAACHRIADEHERWRSRVARFADLVPPEERGRGDSRTGLRARVGFAEGLPVELALDDAAPHALVGGPSGSGKTNLLLTMIGAMAARYPPDELEFYLLDFKEGVSFAQLAPGRHDRTWLPHARLVGVNINTDREFGLALLRFLAEELRRRAEAAKAHEVTKLEELRERDPAGRWPRIVAVIDEFQYLFAERDAVTREATQLLEDVVRRGRSQGIHLVLASQDVSGIEAFWGRPAIIEQFVLRIGLPRARRVLAELNDATLGLPRWHAVLNHESGVPHGNQVVRLPDVTGRAPADDQAPGGGYGYGLAALQAELHEVYGDPAVPPRLFDGSRAPRLAELTAGLRAADGVPRAVVGQVIDVAGSAATVRLPAAPGRNVGVIGSGAEDAVRVLGAAAESLGRQHAPGTASFVLAPLVAEGVEPARRLAGRLAPHAPETVRLDALQVRVEALAAEVTARRSGGDRSPRYLVVHGVDAADAVLDRAGTDALRTVLRFGPETGVHVLGWWRSAQRLKALLTMTASADDLGCWVGLDVQGAELGVLAPGMLLAWSPRPGRALVFDRAQHARPEVVIVPAAEQG